MRVQGTMANVDVDPVYNTYRASLPLVRRIGLGPHVAGYGQLPGAVRHLGGAPFGTMPVRVLALLHSGMCEKSQEETMAPFTALWYRASPNGRVDVYRLRGVHINTPVLLFSKDLPPAWAPSGCTVGGR
jgi:hypothetical protein